MDAAGERWSTNSGGGVVLYGANDHEGTMLTLKPGEWVRVIGQGRLRLEDDLVKLARSGQPADHIYAKTSLYSEGTLATATLSATLAREVCLTQIPGQSVPIELTIP
jgi:hypothetical protein